MKLNFKNGKSLKLATDLTKPSTENQCSPSSPVAGFGFTEFLDFDMDAERYGKKINKYAYYREMNPTASAIMRERRPTIAWGRWDASV